MEGGSSSSKRDKVPSLATESVLKASRDDTLCGNAPRVRGYNFEGEMDYERLFDAFANTGYQASNLFKATELIEVMLRERVLPFDVETDVDDEFVRRRSGCTIFLGYTSNMISSGLRESICYLVKNSIVDCIVTTAGGVEEDLIKCLRRPSDLQLKCDTFLGEFNLAGSMLRDMGINRIGNLLVPNQNYCAFEDWIIPILDSMLNEQNQQGIEWTPSKVIERLGIEIGDEDSVCYWAAKNKIPIFCPALTDGSIGDMIFFHTFKNPGLRIDIVQDIRRLPTVALRARKSGVIILGGGVCKHHILNANLMRGGAEYSVFVNTAGEFDGSDAGAQPDEAISWGKLRSDAKTVKVFADASIVFPLIVARTFKKFMTTNKRITD